MRTPTFDVMSCMVSVAVCCGAGRCTGTSGGWGPLTRWRGCRIRRHNGLDCEPTAVEARKPSIVCIFGVLKWPYGGTGITGRLPFVCRDKVAS